MSRLSDTEKRARLERALEYGGGTHSVADVVQLIRDGKAQFWSYGDGCIVTEIHDFPRLKAVHYWCIFGTLPDCLAIEHDINPWAVEQGCTVATAAGRKGWGRVAAPTGWRPHMPTFYKPLVGSA
jgi:hypothetical protein